MLTTEQYNSIMIKQAMPIINACLTQASNPNAKSYRGQTNSSQKTVFYFDTKLVEKYKNQIIDIYKDLPRSQTQAAPFGYVAFENFFTTTQNSQRQQTELRMADAFINLSACAGIILPIPLKNDKDDLIGADARLRFLIPTRNSSERKPQGGSGRIPGDE